MNNVHIREMLEAMRGKTIVDKVEVCFRTSLTETASIAVARIPEAAARNKSIELSFGSNFLTYVQWPYYATLEEVLGITGEAVSVDIYAHQLFGTREQGFTFKFNEEGVVFQERSNIEDTLFLDLQRYCEHNDISYEVQ
jgi:hypothetical protein